MLTTRSKVKVLKGQNIYDIALQCYGDVEGVFQLMADNPTKINSLDAQLVAGDYLNLTDEKILKKEVVNYYKQLGKTINTGDETEVGGDFNSDFNNDFNNNIVENE